MCFEPELGMKQHKRIASLRIVCLSLLFSVVCRAADYHVDSETGDDRNTGLTVDQAWKSLDPISAKTFQPGDRILLKSGTHYAGQLLAKGSGATSRPIELASYGPGPNARIDGDGKSLDTLLLYNVSNWNVHDLEITNHGLTTAPFRTGVHLQCDGGQTMTGLHLSRLYVHDVNGDLRKEQEGCGIFFDTRGRQSHFDDLLIEDCHIVHTDRNGLCQRSQSRTRSTHVIIRNNLLEDIGGDGIKLWGTDGGLIEHNIVRGGRMRCDDYAAGIWPFSCDDTVIQFNEVSGMKGVKDGEGFDSDYVCKNSVFQYNYSHNNDGGFMLLCSPGDSYCQGTVVRYNVSQNDGRSDSAVFHFAGNVSNSLIYNNVIFVGPKQSLPLLNFDNWSSYSHHNSFFNNVFYVEGKVTYQWTKSTENLFDHNAFHGSHESPPKDEHAVTGKLPFLNPGGAGDGLKSLAVYQWMTGASVPQGVLIRNNGGRDLFGNPLPVDHAPDVGVAQHHE
jgi:hypothetical protein